MKISLEDLKKYDDSPIEETLHYCERVLYKKTDFSKTENVCWVIDGYEDHSCEHYCLNCAEKIVEKEIPITKSMNRKLKEKGEEAILLPQVDGGWDGVEMTEGPEYCEGCDSLLYYSLSGDGVMTECDHFLRNGPVSTDNNTLFELHRVFEDCIYHDYTLEEWKKLKTLAEITLASVGDYIENIFELVDLD